jgi:hypothetical protein
MANYPTIDTKNQKAFFDDIIKRKEFYELKKDDEDETNFSDTKSNLLSIFEGKSLQFQGQQLFCRNFISVNTPYQRLLIKHGTGTGKTLAALAIAEQFIAEYRGIYASAVASFAASLGRRQFGVQRRATIAATNTTPTVIILGFAGTKTAFIKELFRWPEFGYISHDDREKMMNLRREADSGDPSKIKLFKETYSLLKRRITEKSRGGFYKFYGYQEFVNRIFLVLKKDLDLLKLEKEAMFSAKYSSQGETLEDLLKKHIEAGDIKLNTRLLAQLENSIVICDEAHNLYNSYMKNNYGLAVQYLFDNVTSLRGMLVSATPINSPGEIVDLLNLLSLKDEKRLKRNDIFTNVTEPREMKSDAENIIAERTFGRVSFLQDFSRKYYPERLFIGEEITDIPYLKFIKCPMSKAHIHGYRALLKEKELNKNKKIKDEKDEKDDDDLIEKGNNEDTSSAELDDFTALPENITKENYVTIPLNSYTIYDMVIPKPSAVDDKKNKSITSAVWKSQDIMAILNDTTNYGVGEGNQYIYGALASSKNRNFGMRIKGEFLQAAEISKWSSKYSALLKSIDNVFADGKKTGIGAKIMIYHNRVKLSGVLLIEELLRENGIIDEFSPPADDTRCSICGISSKEHNSKGAAATAGLKKSDTKSTLNTINDHRLPLSGRQSLIDHKYYPARYIIAHNMIDKVSLDRSIAKYISPENAYGYGIKFLIGSKIIRESYDIKDVRYQFIMSEPINIPILIQILGRCIRKNSHANLPPELRNVTVKIFINTLPGDVGSAALTPKVKEEQFIEELHYIEKMKDYLVVQRIEKVINSYAIDSNFYRSEINTTFGKNKNNQPIDSLDLLYFEPAITFNESENTKKIEKITFDSYGFGRDETKILISLIKKQFFIRPVFTYDELWNEIKNSEQKAINPAMFDEDNFIIALSFLVPADENHSDFLTNIRSTSAASKKKKSIIELSDTTNETDLIVQYLFNTNNRYIYKNGRRHIIKEINDKFILFPVDSLNSNLIGSNISTQKNLSNDVIDFNIFIEEQIGDRNQYFSIPLKSIKKIDKSYEAEKEMFRRKFCSITNITSDNPFFLSFVSEYSENFQQRLLHHAIIAFLRPNRKVDEKSAVLYKKILELYSDFNFLVRISDLDFIAADVKKEIGNVPRGAFVGYKYKDEIRIFKVNPNSAEDEYIKIQNPRIKEDSFVENDYIIGFTDVGIGGRLSFKIRRSISSYGDILKGKSRGQGGQIDLRILDRGINCIYKSKEELLKIAKHLSITIDDILSVFNKNKGNKKVKIKHLCFAIRDKLLRLEMKERHKGSSKKWFYLWWDKVPDLLK